MLLHLHVKNLALIRETEIDFTEGLNILTGETGAGKPFLLVYDHGTGRKSFQGNGTGRCGLCVGGACLCHGPSGDPKKFKRIGHSYGG